MVACHAASFHIRSRLPFYCGKKTPGRCHSLCPSQQIRCRCERYLGTMKVLPTSRAGKADLRSRSGKQAYSVCQANTCPRAALLQLLMARQQRDGFHSHRFCHWSGTAYYRYLMQLQQAGATAVQLQASVRAVRGALSALAVIPGLSSGQLGLVRWGLLSPRCSYSAERTLEPFESLNIKSQFFFRQATTGLLRRTHEGSRKPSASSCSPGTLFFFCFWMGLSAGFLFL